MTKLEGGTLAMIRQLSTQFYWQDIYHDVEDWVSSSLVYSNKAIHCHTYCRPVYLQHFYAAYPSYWPSAGKTSKRESNKPAPSLHPIKVRSNQVGIDLIELPVSSNGNCYVLMFIHGFKHAIASAYHPQSNVSMSGLIKSWKHSFRKWSLNTKTVGMTFWTTSICKEFGL